MSSLYLAQPGEAWEAWAHTAVGAPTWDSNPGLWDLGAEAPGHSSLGLAACGHLPKGGSWPLLKDAGIDGSSRLDPKPPTWYSSPQGWGLGPGLYLSSRAPEPRCRERMWS